MGSKDCLLNLEPVQKKTKKLQGATLGSSNRARKSNRVERMDVAPFTPINVDGTAGTEVFGKEDGLKLAV